MNKTFALVDCNNFYASCEKLFRPDLVNMPVVVLSNNDGCVIARSREAKALGIKMGVPYFQVRELVDKHRIVVFSSNYALYADISSRVMSTLEQLAPAVEVYSIDEAFLDLTFVEHAVSLTELGLSIRQTIQDWIGMTVCVGIAPSKTLAKLANHAAKKWQKTAGVVDLTSKERQRKLMALLSVSEVWGVGGKLTKRLNELGIYTVLQLADASPKMLRRQFSVVLERTVAELNGESCLALEDVVANKKEIVSSRAFSDRITELSQMQQAVSEYVHRASEKLRSQNSKAKQLTVFIRTSPFSNHSQDPFYSNSATGVLVSPTDDTRDFLHLAGELLKKIWKDGYRYAKAGVMLADFYDEGIEQLQLFTNAAHSEVNEAAPVYRANSALMTVLDEINHSGKAKVFFAAKGLQQDWAMKRKLLSPAYTTKWSELPKAN
jgi:DNA polymerase V